MKIIISGGGTGGHLYPAIAIANKLKEEGIKDILFVGAKGKIEMEKVPKLGYPIEGLWISGFNRTNKLKNFLFPIKLIASLIKAKMIIEKFRPDIVIGVGGFASGPVLKIAQLKKIPTVIQEQNSYPGVTNKLLAKKADKILVAYDGLERFFDKDKIKACGNPVRKDLLRLNQLKQEAVGFFDFDLNKKTILVFGGSNGARTINRAVLHHRDHISANKDVQLIWQVGKIYYDEYKNCALAKQSHVKILPFIDRMDLAYALADMIVCRAGALTISEISLLAKPAILVPSPYVAEDHQSKNAISLVNENAALMIRDKEAEDQMIPAAFKLLEDEETQQRLSTNLKLLAKPNATNCIVAEILNLVNA